MEGKKWYGLTIPKKAAKVNTKGKSVFESDDSDDNAEDHTRVKKEPVATSKEKKKIGPEPKPEEIDQTIYEYDSIYDEMKASQKQKTSHTKSKEPRYINLLLKAAEKRKKENERRVERKIQAERVKEGDTFRNKEAFVTSAYRKKMLEMEEEEERERRESALEEMMDSTKQKDLSGFYRHFLKQTVGEEKIPEFGERDVKAEDGNKKKWDCPEADKGEQRSESPFETRNRTEQSILEKDGSHNNMGYGSDRNDSLGKSDTKEMIPKKSNMYNFDKSGHSESKSSSHRSKGRQQSSSSSESEDRNSKSGHSGSKISPHESKSRQHDYSSSDSEGKNSKSGHLTLKIASHESKDRQQSCSSSDSEGKNSKFGHSKSKVSSHRNTGRERTYSSSDSEGKNNTEKSHKKKGDPTRHTSKHGSDQKQKYLHSVRDEKEKAHDKSRSDHCAETKLSEKYGSRHSSGREKSSEKYGSRHSSSREKSSEKYGSRHSSSTVNDQRSKHERDSEVSKREIRVHDRKEKQSSQTSSKPSQGNHGYGTGKNCDNKTKPEHSREGHSSNYNHDEIKKHSGSKRRDSSISGDYPEHKKRRHGDDDDDDDDTSHTSSDEDKVKPTSSPTAKESNETEKPKIDMMTKFAKRTVGKVFDEAQARYFKRRDAAKAIN